MSVMNTHIAPERALVLVDTLAGNAERTGHASKLAYLPACNTVMACRGELTTFGVLISIMNAALLPDFDAVAQAARQALAQAFMWRSQLPETYQGLEVAIVGYSASLGRMHGARFERWPTSCDWVMTPIDPWSLSPNPGYMPEHAPDTRERMVEIARDQVGVLRKADSDAKTGGRLILAELSRDGATIRTVADDG